MSPVDFFQQFAGPIATVIASITAGSVAIFLGVSQVRIARRQVAIATVQAEISYGQRAIAMARMRLDLFEKRFAVFEAARNLLVAVVTEGRTSHDDLNKFNAGVADAVFLFDESVQEYLQELRERVVRLMYLGRVLKDTQDDEKRSRYADTEAELLTSLTQEFGKLTENFKPYLKLSVPDTGIWTSGVLANAPLG